MANFQCHDFYIPLDVETRKIYQTWIPTMLSSNTFLVVSDFFIQARAAALLSYNFLKLYPTSSVLIVNGDKEKDGICAQLKAVGITLDYIHAIKDDKHFKKQCATGIPGVFFVTTKTMINMLGKNSLNDFDFKLMVVCGAEKADSTSGLAKVVSSSFTAGKIFRVLALSFALPKKLAKIQSLTSNLQISKTLIKKTSDHDIGEILFNKETTFMDFKYESRELELLKTLITACIENLVTAEITTIKNLKSLFFLDTEIWLKQIPVDSELRNLATFTAVLIEGYKILVQYGARALFLYFASKSDILANVEEVDEMKELNERLKVVNFGAFPTKEKRAELQCHPKFEELFKIVNTDKRSEKFIVFCGSPFGARAIAEYLTAARVKCIENISDFYNLMKDQQQLRGPQPFTADEAKRLFLQSTTPVMVSTTVDNLGMVMFEFSISMDYLTGGIRYARFGRKSYCFLTEEYESIPKNMRNYEKRLCASDCNHNYKFNTVQSKLKLDKTIALYPILYSVADLKINVNEADGTAAPGAAPSKTAVVAPKITDADIQQGEKYLKGLIGDFSMTDFDNAFNDTVAMLNEHNPRNPLWLEKHVKNTAVNSTPFEKSLHSALFDPLNPAHLSFASKFPEVEFAEWESEDQPPPPPPKQQHHHHPKPKNHQPTRFKKTKSTRSLESAPPESTNPLTDYFPTIKDQKLSEIQEKMIARRMHERQRWLCVIRDAIKAGQYVAASKDIIDEIEKLPPHLQFWDCV